MFTVLEAEKHDHMVGVPWKPAYRLLFNYEDFQSLLNVLSDTLGEGVVDSRGDILADNWMLSRNKTRSCIYAAPVTIVVLPTTTNLSLLPFGTYQVEDNTTTHLGSEEEQHIFNKIVKPYLFKKVTPKLERRLRQEIASYFHTAWYKVKLAFHNGKVEYFIH